MAIILNETETIFLINCMFYFLLVCYTDRKQKME